MGFMSMGPLGALAGYFIGAWFDRKTAEGQGAAQGTAEERGGCTLERTGEGGGELRLA